MDAGSVAANTGLSTIARFEAIVKAKPIASKASALVLASCNWRGATAAAGRSRLPPWQRYWRDELLLRRLYPEAWALRILRAVECPELRWWLRRSGRSESPDDDAVLMPAESCRCAKCVLYEYRGLSIRSDQL